MTAAARVAVIVPTRDRAELLPRALDSVLAQTEGSFELIVVDDGSTDGTAERVARWRDPRLRLLRQERLGVCAARNLGARSASAPVLTFLDSDDEARPRWLERLAAALADPRAGIACCGCVRAGAGGRAVEQRPERLGAVFERQTGSWLAGTFAVRRELFEAAGGYDEALSFSENTELAMRLVPACLDRGLTVAALDEALVTIHETRPAAGGAEWLRRCLASSERILERHHERLARDGRVHGLLLATAGVRAARLGDYPRARGHFGAAARARPGDLRHAARWLLASLPVVGGRVWGRAAAP